MEGQAEKVYVAVGNDVQDGFKTLNWTLKKWKSEPISIVILHITYNFQKDYVYTPIGKLPAKTVNDEMIEVMRRYEEEKTENLLSKYISFCGKVRAEILKVEKCDEPIHKLLTDLISRLKMTKLVIGFTFMKLSWKSKGAISGSFYVHQNKPEFCDLFIICGGRQVYLRGKNDEKIIEDDDGVTVAKVKDKVTFKDLLDKVFTEKSSNNNNTPDKSSRRSLIASSSSSSTSLDSADSQNQRGFYVKEIQDYYQELLSSDLDKEIIDIEKEKEALRKINSTEQNITEQQDYNNNNNNVRVEEKVESLKNKLVEAKKTIKLKKKEVEANVQRHAKAEWAISLSNRRAEELRVRIKEDVKHREELKKELDFGKEGLHETRIDLEDKKNKLKSVAELQLELSTKLKVSLSSRSSSEAQLEKAVATRAGIVREIEELRRQREVLRRRIEFCKEKDAIGMAARLVQVGCVFREYSAEEIRLATDNFSERVRLKSSGNWTNVYRGRINHLTVAIKFFNGGNGLPQDDFIHKVKLLSSIRQPHLVAVVGFCSELKCIVFEYMHNGSLRDMLFCTRIISMRRNRALKWPNRIRIAAEICSGLGFLHAAKPSPISHSHLTPSNILLDRNLVAKISSSGLHQCHDGSKVKSDIRNFGFLLVQLLTGRYWPRPTESAMKMDISMLIRVLDNMAGQWPMDLAGRMADLAVRCMSIEIEPNTELSTAKVMEELKELRKKADERVSREGNEVGIGAGPEREDSSEVPSFFLCPIFQEVMKNPHVAADGFSYELETIEEWLSSGHDTSPMTNLRLKHKLLTPNHTLRSLIQDWQGKISNKVAT